MLNMPIKKEKPKYKKNISVYFGHENWNLVLNLMIGIRTSVKELFVANNNLKDEDFNERRVYDLISCRT